MSIKAIALELYRAQQKVSRLQNELEKAALQEQDHINKELQLALAEMKQMRKMLDGAKDPNPFTTRPSGRYGR